MHICSFEEKTNSWSENVVIYFLKEINLYSESTVVLTKLTSIGGVLLYELKRHLIKGRIR